MSFNVWANQGTVIGAGGALTAPWNPNVIYEGNAQILSGTVFKMWFANGPSTGGIYYAESTDGLAWSQYGSNPVIAAGQSYLKIFKNGSTYYAYTTTTANINVYTSPDGINWTSARVNALQPDGLSWDNNAFEQLGVVTVDSAGKWWGYVAGQNSASQAWSMGLVTSTDGIHWSFGSSNPVITYLGPSNFFFQKVGGTYYGWSQIATPLYPGGTGQFPSDILRFYATSPGGPWTAFNSLTYYRTIISEGIGTNAALAATGQVADPSIVAANGNLYMYYTANPGNNSFVINCAIASSTTFAQLVTTAEGVQNVPIPGDTPLTDTANLNILASDNFQRANVNPLVGNWTAMILAGFANAQIVSNTVQGTTNASNSSLYWNALTWANDQWAMITANACSSASFVGVTLRQTSTAGTNTAYRLNWTGTLGGSGTWAIRRTVAGSGSVLMSGSVTLNVGDVILGAVVGSTLYFYLNGNLLGAATDGTPIVSGNAGFTVVPESGSVSSAAISSWSGGSFQNAPAPPPVGGSGSSSWLTVAIANSLRGVRH